jgi:hypothetical protein
MDKVRCTYIRRQLLERALTNASPGHWYKSIVLKKSGSTMRKWLFNATVMHLQGRFVVIECSTKGNQCLDLNLVNQSQDLMEWVANAC